MTTENHTPSKVLNNNKEVLVLAPTPYFSDRGCHIRIYEETTLLSSLGYVPTILTYPLGRTVGKFAIERVPGLRTYTKKGAGFSWHKIYLDVLLWRRAVRLIKQKRPALVHAHLHESAWIAWLLAKQFKLPFVLDVQGVAPDEFPIPGYERWAFARANAICVSSAAAHTTLLKRYPKFASKIYLLEAGIGHVIHTNATTTKTYDVVYSGGWGEKKGTTLLKQALAIVEARRPNTKVLWITPGHPVPYEQLMGQLARARVGVDPKPVSSSEGSAKLLNYLAAGLTAVTLRPTTFPNTQTATEATPNALATAILQALQITPQSVDLTAYTWQSRGATLQRVYEQIV